MIQDRGELALIEDGTVFRHLGYFSLVPGDNLFRGGHYHLKKTECFYIISGVLEADLVDLETDEEFRAELCKGQRVAIFPNCAHRFKAREEAHVIEYYEGEYDADDDLRYDPFFK